MIHKVLGFYPKKIKQKICKLFFVKKKSVNLKEMTWVWIHFFPVRIQDLDLDELIKQFI
jgi:hypothetical protein